MNQLKSLSTGNIRQVIAGTLIHGTDDLLIQHGAYRLKQVRNPHTILFLKGKIMKWDRLRPFFPIAVVTEQLMQTNERKEDVSIIQVDNLDEAYWKFINDYRDRIDIPIIAVTGTSGKTTTKEMIRHLLTADRNIAFTNSTNNSRTAHLAYLLSMDETTEAAVFETAVGAPGDILNAAAYLKPTVGIITNIGEHHLNHCKSLEGYIAAKGEMCKALTSDGVLILNEDDNNTRKLDLKQFTGQIRKFGIHHACHYRASKFTYSAMGMDMTLEYNQQKYEMFVPGLGEHQVYNALAAIAAVHQIGMSFAEIAVRLKTFQTLNKQVQLRKGLKGSILIDDTWSITTTSLEAALKVLQEIGKGKRRIAIIGTITDLGSWGYTIHELAGKIIAASDIDILITIGKHAKIMGDTVKQAGKAIEVHSFNNQILAYQLLRKTISEETAILIKGDMYSEPIKKLAELLREN
ncbi:UDP-N-acetylmuramoyl-tripeptide--D-alanyl-D-alanine ligase [Sporosarcina luteola]|uniref:UDP-N-acetylmuramoyl-tripeptide--D-alanyl-D-alanine ligase n=1 Tax=Sporosarcina luteola TaxID=582850 RepID=A0A511Z5G9_9BACL|nr:Mur ligase family protein [Sporosarcina luteola]GEN82693.1 UDP-N-acetylmuramoyl-tripeptide--D-alanyl-D-alanine ligase [Sporosarcina luteola]